MQGNTFLRFMSWHFCSVLMVGVASGQAAAAGSAPAEPVAAVWQQYELPFHYFGHGTYYSCSGLEDRLEAMLRQLGAADDVRVSASGCMGIGEVSNTIMARIKVNMPAPAQAAPAQTFAARSTVVTLKAAQFGLNSDAASCDLLEAVRDQLLPELKLEKVDDDLSCVPGQPGLITRSLQVRALLPEKVQP